MPVWVGEATEKPYRVSWDCCIWVCFSCGEMFDSEICWSFTGECYECYPRPEKMKEAGK